jgi:hypothetical protein
MLGDIPPYLLDQGKNVTKYYNKIHCGNQIFIYQFKTQDEMGDKKEWKKYFKERFLEDLVLKKHFKGVPEEDKESETEKRTCFIDFLKGVLQYDPKKRWNAEETLLHPFITGERFSAPYVPYRKKPTTPRGYYNTNINVSNSHSPKEHGIFPVYGTPTSGSYPNKFPESPMNSSGKWFGTSPKNKVSPRGAFPSSPFGSSGTMMSPREKKEDFGSTGGNRKGSVKGGKQIPKKPNLDDEEQFGLMFEESFEEKKDHKSPRVHEERRSSGSYKNPSFGSFSEDKKTNSKTNPIPISKHDKK